MKQTTVKNTKHTKVREWYVETYPHDELAHSIAENITFEDVSAALDNRKDVYKLFGVVDSCIRENIFSELAVIMEVNYDYIYDQWLSSDEEAEEIVIVPNIKYYTCPECQEETLKYAMIDLDDTTNIEEGFSCSECSANFIGVDNELVTKTNPEIAEQSITKMNKVETIHAYVENGDLVKCNNCDTNMLLPCGADKCPKCKAEGCMSWINEEVQECNYDELIKRHYNIKRCNELRPEQYLSKEIIK